MAKTDKSDAADSLIGTKSGPDVISINQSRPIVSVINGQISIIMIRKLRKTNENETYTPTDPNSNIAKGQFPK